MLATIGFNDEAQFLANEVGDKWSNRLLATEFRALQLTIAQDEPQLSFGIGKFPPQPLCIGECLAGIASHALTLPPLCGSLPLPRGERE